MIQDIEPYRLDNTFSPREVREEDCIALFNGNETLLKQEDGERQRLLTWREVCELTGRTDWILTYLFRIDGRGFYLAEGRELWEVLAAEGAVLEKTQAFRTMKPGWMAFGGITAHHLYHWYVHTRFCGQCGKEMSPDKKERAMRCPACGNLVYPRISPAVIVGVTHGDKILLTKYAGRAFTNYALIAGFTEFGETLEDTVRREVMEEVGVHVKNIRYYKNQPWAFSESLLVGFYAELDGDESITLEEDELAEAVWVERKDMPERRNDISLTAEMMEQFRLGLW
ncbi:MAG: NAD(+) diphosphatase [Lachnospiraceae bacterium]|nr:NAD(+) diphosphatase [Lachnospiraceae bacterium]